VRFSGTGSKHHLITEAHGIPLAASLIGGNRTNITQLMPLVQAIPPVRGRRGRPRQRPDAIYADRGYDFDKYRRQLRAKSITPVIARRSTEHGSGLGVHRWGWSSRSRCCTGSGGSGSAERSATTSTRPSSASHAPSSAGADCGTSHFVRSSKGGR
jgi:Transposase DDE domain